jgi:ubiquinone biosynthesis protein
MRRYLFQSVVDLIALVLGFLLIEAVSLLWGGHTTWADIQSALDYLWSHAPAILVFSIVLTAVHWFVRPLLVIIFGSWLMRSFGIFRLFLDMLLFSIALGLTPVRFATGTSTPWWSIPVAALLFDLLDLLVGTVLGLNRPAIRGGRANEGTWRLLERLPGLRRNWVIERLRLQEVYSIISSFAIDIVFQDTLIGRLRRRVARLIYRAPNPVDGLTTPAKIRVMLQRLGPTYVKFGQMAASQMQLLPAELADELAHLQSHVPAVPFEQAREVIVRELGQGPEELFATFDTDAFAAASMAQVHRATLPDGTKVAVKVQRPNILATVRADLGVMEDIVDIVEGISSYARDLNLAGLLAEFSEGVLRELDYHNEAYYAARFAEELRPMASIEVPAVYLQLSASRVLTMEFVEGIQVNAPGVREQLGGDADSLVHNFMRSLIKQIFIDGFFHADPHPGNILFDPNRRSLTYIDLGLMGRLDQAKRLDLIDLLISFQQTDAGSLAKVALRVTDQTRPVNMRVLRDDIAEMLNQYVRYSAHPTFETMTTALITLLQRHGLRLDRQFTLAVKAAAQSQEVVAALGGNLADFVPFAAKEVGSLAMAEFTPDKVQELLKQQIANVGKELLHRAADVPDAGVSWLNQLMRGRFAVQIDTEQLNQQLKDANNTLTQLIAGLIVTGMIVGTAIVTTRISELWPVYIVLLIIGIRLFWRMLRRPARRDRRHLSA